MEPAASAGCPAVGCLHSGGTCCRGGPAAGSAAVRRPDPVGQFGADAGSGPHHGPARVGPADAARRVGLADPDPDCYGDAFADPGLLAICLDPLQLPLLDPLLCPSPAP